MQQDSSGSSPSGSNSGSSGGAPPPTRHTRYNTLSAQPPKLGSVMARLLRRAGRTGLANKNAVVGAIRAVDSKEYGDSAAHELFRFLEAYGALYQKNGRWWVEELRFQELEIACTNSKPLPYDFVVGTVPGSACGAHQGSAGSGTGKPGVKGSAGSGSGGRGKSEKLTVIKRVAYMSHLERHTLAVIDAASAETVVGEFRSPTHLDDEAFRTSEFGQLFGWPRALFVATLERFVAAGIIAVRPATGPDGTFDALVFQIPFAELQIVEIIDRRPLAIPAIVMDLIVRTLDLEGLTSFKDGLTVTVRKAMAERLSRRGIGHGDKVVGVFADRLFHYNEAAPENGWGLVLPGGKGVDAMICLPGFAPVQFVEDSTMMRELTRDVIASVTATKAEPPPPTPTVTAPPRTTVADVQSMDEAALPGALAEAEALVEALKAESARREEARTKAARRAEIEARLQTAREAEAARAADAERARQLAEAARQEAERVAAENAAAQAARQALEAELAAL